MRARIVVAVLCAVIASDQSSAQVVINENIRFGVSPDPALGDYQLATSKCVTWDAPACSAAQPSIHFDYENGVIDARFGFADEGIDLFLVQPNDVFSSLTVQTESIPVIHNLVPPKSSPPVPVGTTDFYLGVRTGLGFVPPFTPDHVVPNRDVYGWVHLRPLNGVLTMVENVVSYNSRGIVVGATTVVPEPTSSALVAIAMLLGLLRCQGDRA
jgi:hypothetical protein